MWRILLCSIAGTSLMTIYSYRKSKKQREQFREPLLLGKFIRDTAPEKIPLSTAARLGWVAHYAIGAFFNMAYDRFWKNSALRPGAASGLLLGVPSGLLGMAAWCTALKGHPNPPRTDFQKYIRHLFKAHIVFGVSSAVTYKVIRKLSNS
ncbi:hypothetical protein [Zobellia alginiliquefaciens]|uniref:hypothetical protein n=1 Tax=Zobellia alginiliquefaciens TaxID=3032586 RepID=UPI0023E439BD|nr:hypothetical protein [Zobellia alginiliquefaciens]